MLRTKRTLAALVRSMSVGAISVGAASTAGVPSGAAIASAALVSTSLLACQDESQPDYWVEKLSEPQYRARSVKRLEQFFEDALTTAGKDMSKPEVTGLLDKIIEPLTKVYVDSYGELDEKTRVALIKLIAGFRDERGAPALTKAFEEFGKRGRGADDMKWAARAVGDMKLEAAAPAMLEAFTKLRAASKDATMVYRDFNEAMVKMANPGWTPELIKKLEEELVRPSGEDAKKPNKIEDYKNQLFWQTSSAQVLGEIGDPKAVDALIKVVLDPNKVDVHATAVLALVKIGKPAVDRAIKILQDKDPKMAEFAAIRTKKATGAKQAPTDKPHVRMAAIILGTIGDKAASGPMVQALKDADNDTNKTVIASNLPRLPASPENLAAFKEAYEGLSDDASMMGQSAKVALLADPVSQFLEPSLIPWLVEQAGAAKGDQKQDIQNSAALAAIKLMTPKEMGQVKSAVARYGSALEKEKLKQATDLVTSCKSDLNCYLAEIQKSKNQNTKNQFVGIKAGYMLALLGDSKTPDEIVKIMPTLENAAVRYVAAQAIDHLLPNGSKEVADKLDAIVEKNQEAANKDMMAADKPVRDVAYRLRSRAN